MPELTHAEIIAAALGRTVARTAHDPEATNLIAQLLTMAKAQMDAGYRERQTELGDFLAGTFIDSVTALIKVQFPTDAERLLNASAGLDFLNIVAMMARTLAVVFHSAPELHLRSKSSGERLPPDEPRVKQLARDVADMELPAKLKQLDTYVTTYLSIVNQIAWRKGKLRWINHPPHMLEVAQDPADPGELEDALGIFVRLPQPVFAAGSTPVVRYQAWLERDGVGRMYVTDDSGGIYQNALFADNVSTYKGANGNPIHPFVMWRAAVPVEGGLWLPERQEWWAKQRQINLAICDIWNVMHSQAFSVPVLENWAGEKGKISYGPGIPVVIEAGGKFHYETPTPNVKELEGIIDNALRRAAVADGLPPDTWTNDGATRNLGALKLLRQPLAERRTEKIGLYAGPMARAWERIVAVGDAHADERGSDGKTRVRYRHDVELEVVYATLPEPGDKFQDAFSAKVLYESGRESPVTDIQRDQGLTRERAMEVFERNLDDAALMRKAAAKAEPEKAEPPDPSAPVNQRPNTMPPQVPPPTSPPGMPRPPDVRDD